MQVTDGIYTYRLQVDGVDGSIKLYYRSSPSSSWQVVKTLWYSLDKPLGWTYVGNVYWGDATWTVPENGFIEVGVSPSNAQWYLYISDSTSPTGWSHCMNSGYGVNETAIFFVKKGAMLRTVQMAGVNSVSVYYYSF